MVDFTRKELNLISIYDPGTRNGMIAELEEMITYLMPDGKEVHRTLMQCQVAKGDYT